jgi:hypothetical protein
MKCRKIAAMKVPAEVARDVGSLRMGPSRGF